MTCCKLRLIFVLSFVFTLHYNGEAARILSFFPVPAKSHNGVIRPILEELLKRGHEIVIVTVDPMYKNREKPENLTEIDISDVSYSFTRQHVITSWTQTQANLVESVRDFFIFTANTFLKQIQLPEVQRLLNDKKQKFDLLFLDATSRTSIVLSHLLNVPVIIVATTGAIRRYDKLLGVPTHPILYPQCFRLRVYGLTMWEKIKEIYTEYLLHRVLQDTEVTEDQILNHLFGPETPPLVELEKNIDMLFYGDQEIWEDNRPLPPSVIYIGGINKVPPRQLPKDIQEFLDKSTREVIYVSFGTNINPSDLPVDTVELLTRVFSNLPYHIFWKWDSDKHPGRSQNIRTFKWLPQADFLRHPKVKLFITHAGLRSTEDAIEAGVPLIGIPMFLDQFFNSEKYARHGIGLKLDRETLTDEQLTAAINTIMGNKSYQQNVIRLRNIMNDHPMTSLERAVWWTEHVLRHGGARHLRAPAANMPWTEYYELKLVLTVLISVFGTTVLILFGIYITIKLMLKRNIPKRKLL